MTASLFVLAESARAYSWKMVRVWTVPASDPTATTKHHGKSTVSLFRFIKSKAATLSLVDTGLQLAAF